ncbi:MAG TPA: hypothetical protein VGG09_14420 [Acidimicrobiales bacterium]
MGRRRWWPVICISGALVTLAPLASASAGASSKTAVCRAVTTEEHTSDTVGLSLERALASGNFASSKQAMLGAYGTDQRNVSQALAAAKSAPPAVRAAFTNLLSFVRQVRNDIESSTGFKGLLSSFGRLAKNPKLVSDGAVIAHWDASVCPSSTTTTSSSP